MLDGPKVRLTMVNLKGAKFWPSFKFLAVQNYGPQLQFLTVQNYSQQTNFGRFRIQPITVILDGPKLHPRIVNLGSLVQFKFYQRNFGLLKFCPAIVILVGGNYSCPKLRIYMTSSWTIHLHHF